MAFVAIFSQIKLVAKLLVAKWAASYSACVVYTKTIIPLSVGETGRYLPLLW